MASMGDGYSSGSTSSKSVFEGHGVVTVVGNRFGDAAFTGRELAFGLDGGDDWCAVAPHTLRALAILT